MTESKVRAIAVMTSGGDSPGMNAAVRAVVRMGLHRGLQVYAIHYGWQGAVEGGEYLKEMSWWSVGGILQRGGTMLGSARCQEFRTREGRRKAAANLFRLGVDGIVVIGGDGSLTGARILSEEWPELLREAAALGMIELSANEKPRLAVVGLPGSIDNDTYGTDMSIGADTALHRVVTAADQLASTASAHQRVFVMEVMGRHCGYLALAGGQAAGAHWVLIPEEELEPRWHQQMVASIERGRKAGRKHAIIMQAEGARHPDGLPLESTTVRDILTKQMGADTRVTVLGHVQRGGSPSAYDRVLSTRLGAAAVESLIEEGADVPPRMMGIVNNAVAATPLIEMVDKSQEVGKRIDAGDYQGALDLRGHSFQDQLRLLKLLTRSEPSVEATRGNLLIVTAGHDSPGMNPCLRVLARTALEQGFRVFGARYGFEGLLQEEIVPIGWMDVSGWASMGGSQLGAGRMLLQPHHAGEIAKILAAHDIRSLVIVGGMDAYEGLQVLHTFRDEEPALQIPMLAIPASINNNLPGTDFSIGADTALNNIVVDLDKIKDTASANKRAFVVEVMGYDCGYLALMAGLASGAEQIYLPEEGITLEKLVDDVRNLRKGFERGKLLSIIILSERASSTYDLDTIKRIMDEEGGDLFDVRSVDLGHTQLGGPPSPFDRILAARFASAAVQHLCQHEGDVFCRCMGLRGKQLRAVELSDAMAEIDWPYERPRQPWYMSLRELTRIL
ncbi:MAG: 6-phosphofructokinase [Caldilineales bacterium]|nr:6-phosphofructokinase [Caldilineales bacterium]